jgi:hypothetical protein
MYHLGNVPEVVLYEPVCILERLCQVDKVLSVSVGAQQPIYRFPVVPAQKNNPLIIQFLQLELQTKQTRTKTANNQHSCPTCQRVKLKLKPRIGSKFPHTKVCIKGTGNTTILEKCERKEKRTVTPMPYTSSQGCIAYRTVPTYLVKHTVVPVAYQTLIIHILPHLYRQKVSIPAQIRPTPKTADTTTDLTHSSTLGWARKERNSAWYSATPPVPPSSAYREADDEIIILGLSKFA